MQTVNDCHQVLIAAKKRLFGALATRQQAKVKLGQAHQRWAGLTDHESLARSFIATGLQERANPPAKIIPPRASQFDRVRATGRTDSVDDPTNTRRRGFSGLVRGSHV